MNDEGKSFPIYLEIPYYLTKWVVLLFVKLRAIPTDEGSRYYKHFSGNGFIKPNYYWFMDELKERDALAYFIIIITANAGVILLVLLIFSLLFR